VNIRKHLLRERKKIHAKIIARGMFW